MISIDTTVQEKSVAHPTNSRLLEVARAKLAERAAEAGIELRQCYAYTGPRPIVRPGAMLMRDRTSATTQSSVDS